MTDTVAFAGVSNGALARGPSTASPSKSEADILRSLLLSVSDDWRALVIRSVACMYRLRGIIRFGGNVERTPEAVKAAREGLYVYAPLAQRLGMHKLKADLEELAFGILYKRQYAAAAVLYEQSEEIMHETEVIVTSSVEEALRADDMLMSQVMNVRVTSRVKQPYSLWKKMLKERTNRDVNEGLRIQDIHDGIALRVILQARKLSPSEDEESVKAREALLCYYVQKLVLQTFPALGTGRMKDYISQPKENGYQSLHYTASIFRNGFDWPFEVQIRSEAMHRLAEYGVAAHWDYKLQDPVIGLSAPPPPSNPNFQLESAKDIAKKLRDATVATRDISQNTHSSLTTDTHYKGDSIVDDSDVERTHMLSSYIEALTTARDNLAQSQVFVFVSPSESQLDGQILPLSVGATVADALQEAEDRFGFSLEVGDNDSKDGNELELLRNGRPTALYDELSNGDVVVVRAMERNSLYPMN